MDLREMIPDDLHMTSLMTDEIVSMVSTKHPAVRRGWDATGWLEAEHIAPTATHPGARGIIDARLDALGLQRNIMARCAHFSAIPAMVASSLLVLTTGRQFCERFVDKLPLEILDCPLALPPLESVTTILPRATPCPPLRTLSLVSRSSRPWALSKVSEVSPTPLVFESAKPCDSTCCDETRRSTMN